MVEGVLPPTAHPTTRAPRLAAVVLAAGRGARFGGAKLAAPLDGRPVIVHVVSALAVARLSGVPLADIVVVTGFHSEDVSQALACAQGPAVRLIRNRDAGRGISSSLAVGLAALGPAVDACFVVLGDQPRLSPATLEALAERWAESGAAIVVPRHAGGGGPNPVLLARRAWPLATALEGDVGMRQVIDAHPELVVGVDVPGSNPDVDTPEDLAAISDVADVPGGTVVARQGGGRVPDGKAADSTAGRRAPARPRSALDDAPHVQAEDRAAWRAWLAANHAIEAGAWLVTWRPGTGRPVLDYEASVEEALCFGWVDSRPGRVDESRSKLYFARRKARSAWSASNKARVERLVAAGLMAPAGLAAIERAKANGDWDHLDAVERLEVPDDLAAALAADPPAGEHWATFPRSIRRAILEWIAGARRPATRAARVEETARLAARNERANQWRPKT